MRERARRSACVRRAGCAVTFMTVCISAYGRGRSHIGPAGARYGRDVSSSAGPTPTSARPAIDERTLRLAVGALGVFHVLEGLWQLVAPSSFYDKIGQYGLENTHYVGDVGAFVIAYGIALLLAVGRVELARAAALPRRPLVRLPRPQPHLRRRRGRLERARLGRHAADRARRRAARLARIGLRPLRPAGLTVARVFVAGASGVIGRPLIAQLLAAGHEVTGMTRREEKAEEIRAAGAEAAVCDVFDADALRAAVAAGRPEIVIHQLTALPQQLDLSKKDIYDANNRIRTEGTRNLVAAARRPPARGGWSPRASASSTSRRAAPSSPRTTPTMSDAPGAFKASLEATLDVERQVLDSGLEGTRPPLRLLLRPGQLLRVRRLPGERDAQAPLPDRRRRGRGPLVRPRRRRRRGDRRCLRARGARDLQRLRRRAGGLSRLPPVYAEALGAKRPLRVPRWVARLVAGPAIAEFATTLRGASNAKAKRELGWEPRYASWRTGFAEALG